MVLSCMFAEFQEVRKKHEFFEVCRTPELACEVTLQVSLQVENILSLFCFENLPKKDL